MKGMKDCVGPLALLLLPTVGLVFQRPETLPTPSEYLFKNLATLASVSPIWTRGTTLEGEETLSCTSRDHGSRGPRAASHTSTSRARSSSLPVWVQTSQTVDCCLLSSFDVAGPC